MKAVVCFEERLEVADLPDPTPGRGQVVINVSRCGICGSDLHARRHCDELAEVMVESGYDGFMQKDQRVVLGHEFVGDVADFGPNCRRKVPSGQAVVALPILRGGDMMHPTGLSVAAPGAYAEQVVVEEALMFPVPNGLPPQVAGLTEPMAVGLHAVNRGQVGRSTPAIVIGCGPVGLAVISMLKAKGVRQVIASDLSAGRRTLAQASGADVVVDPAQDSPYDAFQRRGTIRSLPEMASLGMSALDSLARLPIPWVPLMRIGEKMGLGPRGPVVFECVGVPGMIDGIIAATPWLSRIVVVGVCMGADQMRPAMAINKEIDLRFVLGYTPLEFRDTLHLLADGRLETAHLVTGTVGLGGVDAAFAALGHPEAHAKILIDPGSDATAPE
ncbi:MAG TPA: zinc-binding dehydrogenase [Acidimicrobiales bacterium]|jgi:threonine dehydrogenase-like Zn-dependent dehydrogenase|nr:zinc-binding dehydrogenase [Acidimicrobiales bacterium]